MCNVKNVTEGREEGEKGREGEDQARFFTWISGVEHQTQESGTSCP